MERLFKKLLFVLMSIMITTNVFAQQSTVVTLVNENGGHAQATIFYLTDQNESGSLDVVGSAIIRDIQGKVVEINYVAAEGLVYVDSYKVDDYHFVAIFRDDDSSEEEER